VIRLTHIRVKNYRSLFNFEIALQPFTVLIGRNDAGKSSILNAIRLLLEDDATTEYDRYDWCRAAKATHFPRETSITAVLEGAERMAVRRRITVNRDTPATSVLEIQQGPLWRPLSEEERKSVPSIYYLQPRTGALQEHFDPEEENNIFTLIKDWMPPELSEEGDLDRLMRGCGDQSTTLAGYVWFFEHEVYPALRIAFPSDFPLMTLHPEFRNKKDRGRLFVRELTHSEARQALFRLPLDHHGSGLISAVAIALSIAVLQEYHHQKLQNKPLIVGIEEPEVHLHPHAQRAFLNYMKWMSERHQVLASTHSPLFVDRAQPENVIVLRRATLRDEKDAGKEGPVCKAGTTLAIAGDYAGNWREIVQTLGIRLSDALMAGELNLLVEGATEAILFPAMAEALARSGQQSIDFQRVFVVDGQGGDLPHMASLLQGTGNPVGVVLDNDREGQRIARDLAQRDPGVDFVEMPVIRTLPPPRNRLNECEFEDLLDSRVLLEVFNETFAEIPGFEFLPLSYDEFDREQRRLLGRGEPFGWIQTVGSLIGQKTGSEKLRGKSTSDRITKRLLAETAARYVREGRLPVPAFCQQMFMRINDFLGA
jgi:energy-coupling factor transporter ATP-binding protein EcfA2